ncbi:holo-ACP synthase [Rhodoluna sp.]|uniref:holo-ACP synthase n=1 Tax=Rhodoluna sp. TaxID=1969481 RepID=UPI0025F8DEBA|nr:holo-ACP synthase [Rhodoluna sp.]
MIVGIGVDAVELSRFETKLGENQKLAERLFTAAELEAPIRTLAGRFAAKEALIKALSGATGLEWHGMQVQKEASGKPVFALSGKTAEIAAAAGVQNIHLSISHDGDMVIAFVIAEGGA